MNNKKYIQKNICDLCGAKMQTIYNFQKFGDTKQRTQFEKLVMSEEEYTSFIHNKVGERNTTERMKAERAERCNRPSMSKLIHRNRCIMSEHRTRTQTQTKNTTELLNSMKHAMVNMSLNLETGLIEKKKKRRKRKKQKKKKDIYAKNWVVGMPKPPNDISVCC